MSSRLILRLIGFIGVLIIVSACTLSQPGTTTPSVLRTPNRTPVPESSASTFPARPDDPNAAVALLTEWFNASPNNRTQLDALITAWEDSWVPSLPERNLLNGTPSAEADLDGDGQAEWLATLPGAQLLVLWHQNDGPYQASVYPNLNFLARIWRITDINADGRTEIVTQAAACSEDDCTLTVNVLQWQPEGYTDLLFATAEDGSPLPGVTLPHASADLTDTNSDGIEELVMEGGRSFAMLGGIQRGSKEIYAWNGSEYRLNARNYDPIASRHPYFKLMDGNRALLRGNYRQAVRLYQEAITTPYPGNGGLEDAGLEQSGPIIVAAARFQLMLAYIKLGNAIRATSTYEQAQSLDGNYANWTRAFWDAYHYSNDIRTACQAAAEAAQSIFLPGANSTIYPLSTNVICPEEASGG